MRACPAAQVVLISPRMALSATATEFRATLAEFGLAQNRVARWFGVTSRAIRRWRNGSRRLPRGAEILLRLLAVGAITVDQIEWAAVPAPVRTNGGAKLEPRAPLLVEPTPEQSALTHTLAEKIVALAPNACRWPCGDPRHPNFYFCSRPTAAPPYCNEHRIAAHMTPVAPALRPSPCPSDQQELASHGRSPVTREARPRHGTGFGRAEAREGPCAAAAEKRLMRPAEAS